MAASGTDAPTLLEALVRGIFAPTAASDQVVSKSQSATSKEAVSIMSREWSGLSQLDARKNSDVPDEIAAVMKTATGVFKRPAVKLAILPLDTVKSEERD